jgi:dipeptidyl aminopeptidase/acylaminoacyl peptidase
VRGDFAIDAFLLKPPDFDPSRRYPLVLDVHGGPHGYYGYAFSPVQRCLAASGFLVVFANPRGSASYGRKFSMAVLRDWGGQDYADLMAVVDAVLERPYVDPERTGIYGYSYGGYMTAWTIGQTDRFKAAVCGAPVFDLVSAFGTSDIGYFWLEQETGGTPYQIPDWYAAHSPSTYLHRARTPTLIVQGEADLRCPLGQSEQMFVTLLKVGCQAELVRYPGGGHMFPWMGPPEHRCDYLTRVRDWFTARLTEVSATAGGQEARAAV